MKKYYPLFLATLLFFSAALLAQASPNIPISVGDTSGVGKIMVPNSIVNQNTLSITRTPIEAMFPTYQISTTYFSNMKEGAERKQSEIKTIKINAVHAPDHIFCFFSPEEHVEISAQSIETTTDSVPFDFDVQPDATCDPAFAASLTRVDDHTFMFTAPAIATAEALPFTCTITDAQGNKQEVHVSGRVRNFIHCGTPHVQAGIPIQTNKQERTATR